MPVAPDVSPFANRLAKTLAHWKKWARRRGIGCFRVYDRDVPQFPFALDWYQTVQPREEIHLHLQEIDTGWVLDDAGYAAWIDAVTSATCAAAGVPAERLHFKRRERQRGRAQYEKLGAASGPHPRSPRRFVVEESGHRFEVVFDAYLDTGLFLDHRPARAWVAENLAARAAAGRGTRFLNLFAYTGSFSVYAARSGASASTTLDLSNTYQAWTLRNFELNGIDPSAHALARADVLAWLPEAAARGERYDLIVLDPPSFSNSKKMQGVLDVQRDHKLLIEQCLALLSKGGELLFSTNLRSFALDADLQGRAGLREFTRQTVPEDFRRPGHPPPHRAWHLQRDATPTRRNT